MAFSHNADTPVTALLIAYARYSEFVSCQSDLVTQSRPQSGSLG